LREREREKKREKNEKGAGRNVTERGTGGCRRV